MGATDLGDVNLNLLVALDALLREESVTRAAERVGITQSAMSHRLKGLRELFGDALFVRGEGGNLRPTPAAEALRAPIARGLGELGRALRGELDFDPLTARRTFTLGMGDAFVVTLLPGLLARVQALAPGVDLQVRPVDPGTTSTQLEEGALDLALGVQPSPTPGLRQRRLLSDGFSCLVRRDHPRVGPEGLTLALFADLPHALISPRGEGRGVVDEALAEHGLTRRVALRVPYFLAAPLVVAGSDLILTAPTRMATLFEASFGLRRLEPPIPLKGFEVMGLWHERFDGDPAHRWLRTQLWAVGDGVDPSG